MFLVNVKMAARHLMNDKIYSAINVLGLSISLAVSLLVLQYAQFELNYDSFFPNASLIYRATTDNFDGNQLVYKSALSSLRIGPALKSDVPEVKESSQLLATGNWFTCLLRYDNGGMRKAFNEESVFYSGPTFFRVFSWPLTEGDATTALSKPFSVVISQSTAARYFGGGKALGKTLNLKGSYEENDYTVTGVMPDLPENSHLKINVLFSVSSLQHNKFANSLDTYTYLLLEPGSDAKLLDKKISELTSKLSEGQASKSKLSIQPIQAVHLDQGRQDEMKPSGNRKSVYFLLAVATFIVVIALINYVNLTTSRALERAKEVGVRKISGAYRRQLIMQFLVESMIIFLLATIVAVIIVFTCAPWFYELVGLPSAFTVFSLRSLPKTDWYVFTAFGAAIFIAGLYPAQMISSFKPALVLKGRFTGSQKGLLFRRALVVLQFVCTIGLLTGVYVMHDQQLFMQKQDLGLNISRTLVVKAAGTIIDESCYDNIPRFRKRIQELSFVSSVTTSSNIPGQKITWVGNLRRTPEGQILARNVSVQLADPDFFKGYNIKILAGKDFNESDFPKSRAFGSRVENILLNAEAVRLLQFASPEEAVDKTVFWDGMQCTIVGVVADYHQLSLKNPIEPTVFTANLGPNMSIKLPSVKKENLPYVLNLIKKDWTIFFPDSPFDYFFLDDYFKTQYAEDTQVMRLFDIFCCLAVLISSLGLFGLSLFTTKQRTKEIGVRKVLGANWLNLLTLLTKEFLRPIAVACCIGLPVVYFILDRWLSGFAYHLALSSWQFLMPVVLVFVIAFMTISFQTTRTIVRNPVDSLRHE